MSKGVEKEQVEIIEKPKNSTEEAIIRVLEQLEKKVEPPPIGETLDKVAAAMAQAQKAKTKIKMNWYCTDCGRANCQNDDPGLTGMDHIPVTVVDGEFVGDDGAPLSGTHLELMTSYAVPKAESGESSHATSANRSTLSKMRNLKGAKK